MLEDSTLFDKKMDEPAVADGSGREIHPARNLTKELAIIFGRVDQHRDGAWFNAKLLRKRGS